MSYKKMEPEYIRLPGPFSFSLTERQLLETSVHPTPPLAALHLAGHVCNRTVCRFGRLDSSDRIGRWCGIPANSDASPLSELVD